MTAYVAFVWFRNWLLFGGPKFSHHSFWPRSAVALLPIIPVSLLFVAILRSVRSSDEMMRRIQIYSLAIAGTVTALLAVAYGLLEGPDFPHLSAWWTYSVFMIAWMLTFTITSRRYCR
jgi:hypothetical protein